MARPPKFVPRHRRHNSDDDIDEDEFLQFRREDSSQLSRQSSLKSRISQRSLLPDSQQSDDFEQLENLLRPLAQQSQESQESVKSAKSVRSERSERSERSARSARSAKCRSFQASLESQESQASATGIAREFDYLFRASQNDEQVLGLDTDSPVSLSIGVVCVADRQESNNNPEIKAHTLQKTFYSYPKNAEDRIKKVIEDRIENDVADFKLQGYNVTTYTFGLPFAVEEVTNISRGYDGKTRMLRAAKKKSVVKQEEEEGVASTSSKRARK
jgi:hypothetical protein